MQTMEYEGRQWTIAGGAAKLDNKRMLMDAILAPGDFVEFDGANEEHKVERVVLFLVNEQLETRVIEQVPSKQAKKVRII